MADEQDLHEGLPLRNLRTHKRIIIAHHLIWTGYGHWLPNDPPGSGSREVVSARLRPLGPAHFGRKKVQPPRQVLRDFYQEAEPLLDHPAIWFDDAKRQAIAKAFGDFVKSCKYTVWACAIMTNHAHLCIRRHRDDATAMWNNFAEASGPAVRKFEDVGTEHPVWSQRPYKVFLYTPDEVRGRNAYIEGNPVKEGLGRQSFPFVVPYDGWPFHRQTR